MNLFSLKPIAARCLIWPRPTRSLFELRPKPTKLWKAPFCRCFHTSRLQLPTSSKCCSKYHSTVRFAKKEISPLVNDLLRLEAREGRLSLLLSWRARCMRMPGLTNINLTENLIICKNMGSKVQKAKIWILENLIIYKSDIIIYKWRFEDILYGFPYIAAHQERAWKLRQRLEEFHLMVQNL